MLTRRRVDLCCLQETRWRVDLCCLQETRWRGRSTRLVKGKDSIYKFFWSGDQSSFGGVGLAEKWVNNVISVTRYDHRCLQLRFLVGTIIVNVISCYAPQSGLSAEEKDIFYDKITSVVVAVPDKKILLIGGDFNVGVHNAGFEGVHRGNGYDAINQDELRILNFYVANKFAVASTLFQKNISRLITYSSGGNLTQIEILVKTSILKNIKDTKVISNKECIVQHKLLVCDYLCQQNLYKTHPHTT